MTAIPLYERGNTIKSDIDFKSAGVLTNPYADTAKISVIRPDGTYLYSSATANYDGTGEFSYYISTNSSDPLGIYKIVWYAQDDVGGSQGLMPVIQRDVFCLVDVD